jgi:starch synthase (maltosyl-transferring)
MRLVDNDRWAGEFPLDRNGRYRFFIEAVADPFLSWLADLAKRTEAAQDVASEVLEGRALIEATARRAGGADARRRRAIAGRMAVAPSQAEAVAVAHEAALAALLARHLDRRREAHGASTR